MKLNKDRMIDLIVKECKSKNKERFYTIVLAFNSYKFMYECMYALKYALLYESKDEYTENYPFTIKFRSTYIYFYFDGSQNCDGLNPDLLIIEQGMYKYKLMLDFLVDRTKYVKNSKILSFCGQV